MQTWTFDSPDPEQTRAMGMALGRSIGREGLILALVGPLGAGKTVFVKGLAEGLGVDPRLVSSPTFVIAQEYPLPKKGPDMRPNERPEETPSSLHHIDLYRLESEDELEAIGFFDMLAPGNVLAVEWADRFEGVLGRKVLTIELEGPSASESESDTGRAAAPGAGPDARGEAYAGPVRTARLTATGEAAERVLQGFSERAEGTASNAISSGDLGGAGGGSSSTAMQMRLLTMLCLCFAGLGFLWLESTGFGIFAESVRHSLGGEAAAQVGGCGLGRVFVEVESDALGTLRGICADSEPRREAGHALSGIGRLVSGERIAFFRATSELLQTLPGIGPARAESILAHRALGVLRISSDLERVPGIGPKTRLRLERWLEMPSSELETNDG